MEQPPQEEAGRQNGEPSGEETPRGVAGLFSREELKKFFSGYLITLAVIEGFIFFVAWVGSLQAEVGFPWRAYLAASFAAPVAITLVFGLVVIGFNRYMFRPHQSPPGGQDRLSAFWSSTRQIPFLVGLLFLLVGAGLLYKLDSILLYLTGAGEAAVRYLLIGLALLLGIATCFGLIWLVLSYRLRRQRQDYAFRYRQEAMEKTGMIILEDETVIDREGRVIEHRPAEEESSRDRLPILPKLPRR